MQPTVKPSVVLIVYIIVYKTYILIGYILMFVLIFFQSNLQ